MLLWLACSRGRGAFLLVSVHPLQGFRVDGAGRPVDGPPTDRGLLLAGSEVAELLDGIAPSREDASLVDDEHAATHSVTLDLDGHVARFDVHPTAFDARTPEEAALAARFAPLLERPPTHHGHWVEVPSSLPPDRALAALARAGHHGFLQPLRRRLPWASLCWTVHVTGDVDAAEALLSARKDAFGGRLQREVPGAVPFQNSGGTEARPGFPVRVEECEGYEFPLGTDLARVEALVREEEGATLRQGHSPTHYLVSVWTPDPELPELPAPFRRVGPYFPIGD